jgi:carbamoyl-phosphate synthase large subunit
MAIFFGQYALREYFMSCLVPSGVSGNTCEGRVFFDNRIMAKTERAVRIVVDTAGEMMTEIVTVDMAEDENQRVYITEINLRHVAFTSAFSEAGVNMVDAHLLATFSNADAIIAMPQRTICATDLFYRDIDGISVYVETREHWKHAIQYEVGT